MDRLRLLKLMEIESSPLKAGGLSGEHRVSGCFVTQILVGRMSTLLPDVLKSRRY